MELFTAEDARQLAKKVEEDERKAELKEIESNEEIQEILENIKKAVSEKENYVDVNVKHWDYKIYSWLKMLWYNVVYLKCKNYTTYRVLW